MDFPRTTITVAGTRPVRLSVIDVGPTELPARGTIVCIHGAGGNAEQWKNQIAYFSQHYRVIAPDLRGHDQSEQPRSSYTLEEFLWDFTQMLEQLAIAEPFFLLAHSFGGPIGLTFAAAQPQRLSKLVLVATAPEMHLNPLIEMMLKLPLPLRTLERLRPILLPRRICAAVCTAARPRGNAVSLARLEPAAHHPDTGADHRRTVRFHCAGRGAPAHVRRAAERALRADLLRRAPAADRASRRRQSRDRRLHRAAAQLARRGGGTEN